jgi:hypothetical protein
MNSLVFSIAVSVLVTSASAFMPVTTTQGSTVVVRSTVAPPERTSPGAGWEPAWENRPGLTPSEFMKSDMTKPELIDIWECPLTRWDTEGCVLTTTKLLPQMDQLLIFLVDDSTL